MKILAIHHHGIRIGASRECRDEVLHFYADVLKLERDYGRPYIDGVPGYWVYVGEGPLTAQIHLMSVEGVSPLTQGGGLDPTAPHVALAVEDIDDAREWLCQTKTPYTETRTAVGIAQLFVLDPAGNMIELHAIGTCRCNRPGEDSPSSAG
jgi:catechol 2,3-dioxygenase-like lactoylglutathione lyase family enzyme